MKILLKRAYEEASPDDGARFLVDRLWPRGVSKKEIDLTGWLKELAPSPELRRWFGHDPARWEEFRKRYTSELRNNAEVPEILAGELKGKRKITLVYGARDSEHNHALVLKDFLEKAV
ncbi:MAG: DUF488 family protein [Luteolibacter sp.]